MLGVQWLRMRIKQTELRRDSADEHHETAFTKPQKCIKRSIKCIKECLETYQRRRNNRYKNLIVYS